MSRENNMNLHEENMKLYELHQELIMKESKKNSCIQELSINTTSMNSKTTISTSTRLESNAIETIELNEIENMNENLQISPLVVYFEHWKVEEASKYMASTIPKKVKNEVIQVLSMHSICNAPAMFLECIYIMAKKRQLMAFINVLDAALHCINTLEHLKYMHSSRTIELAGDILISSFENIRPPLAITFASTYQVATRHLQLYAMQLIEINIAYAVRFVQELKVQDLLSLDMVLSKALEKEDYHSADAFVRGNKEYQRIYVSMLVAENVNDRTIKKRLNMFQLNANDFPSYAIRRDKSALRYLLRTFQFEEAMEFLQTTPELCLYACEFLIKAEEFGPQHMVTKQFIKQLNVEDNFPHIEVSDEEEYSFTSTTCYEPLETCIGLNDLFPDDISSTNISEVIEFIDTVEQFDLCMQYLKTQNVIGIDCEWKPCQVALSTKNDMTKEAIAVLQIASGSKAFVIDIYTLEFKLTKDNVEDLRAIFKNPEILKLMFDGSQDIPKLKQLLVPNMNDQDMSGIQNIVDLQYLVSVCKEHEVQQSKQRKTAWKYDIEMNEVKELSIDTTLISPILQDYSELKTEDMPLETENISKTMKKKIAKREMRKAMKKNTQMMRTGKYQRISLSAAAEIYLGKPLDKRSRMTNWEKRPLSQAQLHYAAMDALILVKIYHVMEAKYDANDIQTFMKKVKTTMPL